MLNRIDYNVEQSKLNVQRGNEQLVQAERSENSSLGRKIIYTEASLILIFLMVLLTRAL